MDLDLDLESFARDLDLSDLQCLLAEDSSGDEDEYFDLENFFYRNQVEEERELLNKLKRVVDLRDYDLSADIDIENPDDLQKVLIRKHTTMCKISIYSNFI